MFRKHIEKKTELIFGELARSGFVNTSNEDKIKILDYTLGTIYQQERFLILTKEQKETLINSFDEKQKELFTKDLVRVLGL